MKTSNWGITILIIIILVAIFTNPSLDEHRQKVKQIINGYMQSSISESESNGFETLGLLIGNSLSDKLVDNIVDRDNYLLFSITKAKWKGESKFIGFGIFGNVFLSNEVDESFSKSFNRHEQIEDVEIPAPAEY